MVEGPGVVVPEVRGELLDGPLDALAAGPRARGGGGGGDIGPHGWGGFLKREF